MFEAAHLLVATYAVTIIWWAGRNEKRPTGSDLKRQRHTAGGASRTPWASEGLKKLKFLWIVPVLYGIVAGIEAVLAGSVVGLM